MQAGERRPLLRDQKDSRRTAIEAMDELQKLRLGSGAPQPLDHSEADAAPAVHGDPRRLVERDQRIVFVQYPERLVTGRRGLTPRTRGLLPRGRSHRCPNWRNAQLVAPRKTPIGTRPATVHPDLAAAHDAIDMALRYPLERLDEVVVQTLAVAVLPYGQAIDGVLA